jgi:hypothetical protein
MKRNHLSGEQHIGQSSGYRKTEDIIKGCPDFGTVRNQRRAGDCLAKQKGPVYLLLGWGFVGGI